MEVAEEAFLVRQEERSLHYPFPKNKVVIKGDVNLALERIKLVRSGKPHVTGTVPLNVAPEEPLGLSEGVTPETTKVPQAIMNTITATKITTAAKDSKVSEDQLEQIRKQKKRERRLARKAKQKEEAKNGGN
jgi:hypothetical protein